MRYEFRVDGVMTQITLHEAFSEMESFVLSHQTVLFGPVTDQAHLYGLLTRFQSLGLQVMEMRQLPD